LNNSYDSKEMCSWKPSKTVRIRMILNLSPSDYFCSRIWIMEGCQEFALW
jgi:hypothetical protein